MTAEDQRARRRARRRLARARAEGLLAGVAAMLRPSDIAFDCGANMGGVTAQLAPSGAQIHAYEPDPLAFAALQRRFAAARNVTLHNTAVAAEPGTATLQRAADFADDPERRTTRSSILPGGQGMAATAEVVRVESLPALLAAALETRPDIAFVKLDIEGAELDILEAMEARGLFDRIRLTVAETHEGKFPALRPRYKALKARLHSHPRVDLAWI